LDVDFVIPTTLLI